MKNTLETDRASGAVKLTGQAEFWSSVSYPDLMGRLMECLREEGIEATHRYYYRSDQYRSAKTRLQRIRMRLALYIAYPCKLFGRILLKTPRGSRVVVTSNTFYAPLVAWLAGRLKGVKVVHLLFDTYPDALIEAGKLTRQSWTARGIAWVTRRTLRCCDGNVFIGHKLREYAEQEYGQARRAQVISLAVQEESSDLRGRQEDASGGEAERVTLLYCGNLGHLHDVETLPRALEQLDTEIRARLYIRFHASGGRCAEGYRLLETVAQQYPELQVTLGGGLGQAEWEQVMRQADVGIATMRPGAEKVLFPSKTFSAMAMGQAILAICPKLSDLADLVSDSQGGWVVEPGAVDELVGVLRRMVVNRQALREQGERGSRYVREHFSLPRIARQWVEYLQRVG